MTTDSLPDVLILGAGPAGAAAAFFAARQGLRVAVLSREVPASVPPRPEWLYPESRRLLDESDLVLKPILLGVIDHVKFTDPAGQHSAAAPLDAAVPVVDSAALTNLLLEAAIRNDAKLLPASDITAIETAENAVVLRTTTGDRLTGRLLIAADGYDSLAVRSFGLDRPRSMKRSCVCCQVIAALPGPRSRLKPAAQNELTWVLTSDDLSEFGYIYRAGPDLVIGVVTSASSSASADEIRGVFSRTIIRWQAAEILPPSIEFDPANIGIRPIPRGLALDLDTHVAKHSLVTGDAGGFVVAVSHEGLHPAITSAMLAANVCAKALKSGYPQDVLAEFDTLWRVALAEFLRLPNADLRFLLPLVFTNERIARRLANWLLCAKTARSV